MRSNGEVEGPADHASQRPRARNIDWVPRPQTDHASRPPPTIVRRRKHRSTVPLATAMRKPKRLQEVGRADVRARNPRPRAESPSDPIHDAVSEDAERRPKTPQPGALHCLERPRAHKQKRSSEGLRSKFLDRC